MLCMNQIMQIVNNIYLKIQHLNVIFLIWYSTNSIWANRSVLHMPNSPHMKYIIRKTSYMQLTSDISLKLYNGWCFFQILKLLMKTKISFNQGTQTRLYALNCFNFMCNEMNSPISFLSSLRLPPALFTFSKCSKFFFASLMNAINKLHAPIGTVTWPTL